MRRLRNRYLLIIDAVLLAGTVWLLYALRLESSTFGTAHGVTALRFALIAIPLQLAVYVGFGLYSRLWRHASVGELEQIAIAGAVAAIPVFLIGHTILPMSGITPAPVPLSVLIPFAFLSVGIAAAPRFLIRLIGWRSHYRLRDATDRRTLIAGAGMAGEMIVRELHTNPNLRLRPVAFVDDDPLKRGLRLADIPILGSLADIPTIAATRDIEEIIIAMPRAHGSVIREVVRAANDVGIRARIVPGLFEILSGRVNIAALREVQIEDLLRREPVQTNLASVSQLAAGRTVLVTGAGGSIGSELCRQLYGLAPKKLILLDHAENPVFDILGELGATKGGEGIQIVPVIADVRSRDRILSIFDEHRPDVVFHAAAHKHVPLMEDNPAEAVTNNVYGTQNIVDAALEYNCERLVLVSTDKAVRPTNVMGATKRVAEHVVHDAAVRHNRNFVAVRFGNVLGSQGSVVPTFMRQIRAGGPVTVTHPEMRRYFMTIPEAVQLVLQASALGRGGELFMLDMGEPVRIIDLARDMIRLSGLQEGIDVEIQITGVRPGEKLYEEMFFSDEIAEPTEHPKILCARNGCRGQMEDRLIDVLTRAAFDEASGDEIRRLLVLIVPDYAPDNVPAASDDSSDDGDSARPILQPSKRRPGELTPDAITAKAAFIALHTPAFGDEAQAS